MFEKTGQKLQDLAVINFGIGAVGLTIYSLIRIINALKDEEGIVSILLALIILGVGLFVIYIVSLFIHAFGTLVASAEKNAESAIHTEAYLSNMNKNLQQLVGTKTPDSRSVPNTPQSKTYVLSAESAQKPVVKQAQSPAVEKSTATVGQPRSFRDHLAFASRFSTDKGIRDYLERIPANDLQSFTEEEIAILGALDQLPDAQLRQAIHDRLNP